MCSRPFSESFKSKKPSSKYLLARLFSFNDVDKLLEIKDLLDQGLNMAGIKQVLLMKVNQTETVKVKEETKEISKTELRKILRDELQHTGRFNRTSLRQGDISRFFH